MGKQIARIVAEQPNYQISQAGKAGSFKRVPVRMINFVFTEWSYQLVL